MALSDINLKNAKPLDKPYKMPDGKGLYVMMHNNGGKYFRLDYRFEGKRKTLALGTYPDVPLKKARERAYTAKRQLADGIDPAANKQAIKQAKLSSLANSLEAIANEWLVKQCKESDKARPKRFLAYILPWLGGRPIDGIRPNDVLVCLKRVEAAGNAYSAKKALQMYGLLWRYAVVTQRAEADITQSLKGAIATHEKNHFPAITEPKQLAPLLRAIDSYTGDFVTVCALKFSAYTFQRPGEIRAAKWQDIDLETKEWRYFVTKTKANHIVPLSRQVLAVLAELYPLTGRTQYLFPSMLTPNGDRCMSENTINNALKRLGFSDEQKAHGFRATARTILVRDPLGRAYNRTTHLSERQKMMQSWADYLDQIKAGGNVVAIGEKSGRKVAPGGQKP
jgi:integrase